MSLSAAQAQPLPPIAAQVDQALTRMDAEIDWLLALSPIGNHKLWEDFEASGRQQIGPFQYIDLDIDLHAARQRLLALPVDRIESPLLSSLLGEKLRELERQIELVRLRGTDGFVTASISLFGGVEPPLLELANQILDSVQPGDPLQADAGIDEVSAAVDDELAWYRKANDDFRFDVVIDGDLNSMMMVSHGVLYVDANLRLPRARVQPLIQHEVGTHLVTRYNGQCQPLQQMAVGLAHYDALQEGLGVLAEYLAGYLPGERLRVLAARVVATEMAIQGSDVPEIFDLLHVTQGMPTDDAFDVAVRARRGGGLTKDAVYLRGLRDLMDYLRDGGDFAALFGGKFALSHVTALEQLVDHGWVVPPAALPRYFSAPGFAGRLQRCRQRPVAELFQTHPTPQEQAA